MSLNNLWLQSKGQLGEKHVQAMVGLAGDGKLRAGSKASMEFREFLAHAPSSLLTRYALECVAPEKFPEAPNALQDIINQVGSRAGFVVEHGLYRGKAGEIGFDGIWRTQDGYAIILEVKTTDAYTIDLDTLADYRKRLVEADRISKDRSSILIVVGRSDTAAWEAQIRGSPHAWDIRMISVNALMRLMTVKEELEDPQVVQKIRAVLTPKEFTKVDEIIDLVFSAAEEAKQIDEVHPQGNNAGASEATAKDDLVASQSSKPRTQPVDFREEAIRRIQAHTGNYFVRRSPAIYSTPDETVAVCCLQSREYEEKDARYYWFGFRRSQRNALANYSTASIAYCCGSVRTIALIPLADFEQWLDLLSVTDNESAFYWHVHLRSEGSRLVLETTAQHKDIDLTRYLLRSIEAR